MAATITAHIPRVHLAEHPRPPDSTRLPPRPRRPRSAARVTCKKSAADQSAAAFEAKKSVHVDYDEGRHEVWTRVSGLRKKDIPMRYRIRVEGDRFQKDWTVSVVVEKVMEIKHWEDVHGVLNRWVGRFARKNFPLLIKEITKTGSIGHSNEVFKWMKNQKNYCARKDIYNMMIRLHARHNLTDQARGLFFEMQKWRCCECAKLLLYAFLNPPCSLPLLRISLGRRQECSCGNHIVSKAHSLSLSLSLNALFMCNMWSNAD